jgi:hypothetical protein
MNQEIFELRLQVDELDQQMSDWRNHLALQEEMAFFATKAEELARRLNALEKRIAHESDGQTVEIRFQRESDIHATW